MQSAEKYCLTVVLFPVLFFLTNKNMAPLVASPWTIKATPESPDYASKSFSEVMSEDLARQLHDDEEKGMQLAGTADDADTLRSQSRTSLPLHKKGAENSSVDATSSSKHNNLAAALIVPLDCFENSECSDDLAIALSLQSEFNNEYNDLISRREYLQNRNEHKIRVSYDKYRLAGETEVNSSENFDLDGPSVPIPDESDIPTFNARGFCVRSKQVITKHDAEICGRRNASKLMSFPSNFNAGDDTEYGSRLSNRVYNELKQHSIQAEARAARRHDKKQERATTEQIDRNARVMLFKMVNSGVLESVSGAISTGKEAIVFHAYGGEESYSTSRSDETECRLPPEVAIKMFKVTMSEFQNRDEYIKEDFRFKDRLGSKQNARKLIKLWTEKEFSNLKRLRAAGVPCPDPLILKKYTIIMSFIGEDQKPAPQLKHAEFSDADKIDAYEQTKEIMKTMFQQARLVHGDFSEYNLLWLKEKVWVIDVSQSVEVRHPSAMKFLYRDCESVTAFFRRIGTDDVLSVRHLIQYVTGHQFKSDDSEELIYEMGNAISAVHNRKIKELYQYDKAESLMQRIKHQNSATPISGEAARTMTAALSFAKTPKSRQKFSMQQQLENSDATSTSSSATLKDRQSDNGDGSSDSSWNSSESDDGDEDKDYDIPNSPDLSSVKEWRAINKQSKTRQK